MEKNKYKNIKLGINNAEGNEFIISKFFISSNYTMLIKELVEGSETNFYFISEIKGSLDIEADGSSRKIIKSLINGSRIPKNDNEQKALNLYAAMNYIRTIKPEITKQNIMIIYNMLNQNLISGGDELEDPFDYRKSEDEGYVDGFKTPSQKSMRKGMDQLINFINSDKLNDYAIEKSLIIQIIFIYFHPFYDFNGRTGRLLSYWYLTLKGFEKARNILYLCLPNNKSMYINIWRDMRKFKWNDLNTFLNFFGGITTYAAQKTKVINNLAISKGIKFNETETLILFNLLDKKDWQQANQFMKKIDLGITKQGILKSLNNLNVLKLVDKKISKNTLFIKTRFLISESSQSTTKKFYKKIIENRGDSTLTNHDI